MIIWNDPDNLPAAPGEYAASLDPTTTSPTIRRWWDGKSWSNPYIASAPDFMKARIRQERSAFLVYWAPITEEIACA